MLVGEKVGEEPIKVSVYYPAQKKVGYKIGGEKPQKPDWAPNGQSTINGMFNNAKFSK